MNRGFFKKTAFRCLKCGTEGTTLDSSKFTCSYCKTENFLKKKKPLETPRVLEGKAV